MLASSIIKYNGYYKYLSLSVKLIALAFFFSFVGIFFPLKEEEKP